MGIDLIAYSDGVNMLVGGSDINLPFCMYGWGSLVATRGNTANPNFIADVSLKQGKLKEKENETNQ
jgi:hypothetical protein